MKPNLGSLPMASQVAKRNFQLLLFAALMLVQTTVWGQQASQATPYNGPKGRETWAFRCVLDGQPRVLVLAMHPHLWLAYNTTTGHLWKSWTDGVKLEGTIYTTKHGPQPTSKGDALQRTESETIWRISRNEKTETPKVQYLGHRFEKDGIVISTKLTLPDGANWTVEERPSLEVVAANSNSKIKTDPQIRVVRRFSVITKEQGATISQYLVTGNQATEADFQVNGGSYQKLTRNEVLQPRSFYGYSGWLTLSSTTTTYQSYPASN